MRQTRSMSILRLASACFLEMSKLGCLFPKQACIYLLAIRKPAFNVEHAYPAPAFNLNVHESLAYQLRQQMMNGPCSFVLPCEELVLQGTPFISTFFICVKQFMCSSSTQGTHNATKFVTYVQFIQHLGTELQGNIPEILLLVLLGPNIDK